MSYAFTLRKNHNLDWNIRVELKMLHPFHQLLETTFQLFSNIAAYFLWNSRILRARRRCHVRNKLHTCKYSFVAVNVAVNPATICGNSRSLTIYLFFERISWNVFKPKNPANLRSISSCYKKVWLRKNIRKPSVTIPERDNLKINVDGKPNRKCFSSNFPAIRRSAHYVTVIEWLLLYL